MNAASRLAPTTLRWLIGVALFIAVTNRYTNPVTDAAELRERVSDSFAYLAISEAAPSLPAHAIGFQHAQRIAVPYAVGVISHGLGMSPHVINVAVVILACIATLLILIRIIDSIGLQPNQATLILAVAALNPWSFRFYLAYPELIDDPAFVLGVAIVMLGIVEARPGLLLGGALLASLSRQTGLLLLPMILLSLLHHSSRWSLPRSNRLFVALGAASVAVAVYLLTAVIASGFATPDRNAALAFDLFRWIANDFSARGLLEFWISMAIPVLIPLTLVLAFAPMGKIWRDPEMAVPLAGTFFVCAQPFLSGPVAAAGAGPRLVTLGILPLQIAAAVSLRDSGAFAARSAKARMIMLVVILAAASLQHLVVGARLPLAGHRTAALLLYAACTAAFIGVCILERRAIGPSRGCLAEQMAMPAKGG